MHLQVDLLVAGLIGFSLVTSLQKWFANHAHNRAIEDEKWASTVDDWSKLTRQDVATSAILLSVTNGLLAAIAAILIFR
jgi:hypothetical protein